MGFLCLLIILNEVKGFLLLFKIFMGFFVKEIIKDFCWIFACGIFREFLLWGFWQVFGTTL